MAEQENADPPNRKNRRLENLKLRSTLIQIQTYLNLQRRNVDFPIRSEQCRFGAHESDRRSPGFSVRESLMARDLQWLNFGQITLISPEVTCKYKYHAQRFWDYTDLPCYGLSIRIPILQFYP